MQCFTCRVIALISQFQKFIVIVVTSQCLFYLMRYTHLKTQCIPNTSHNIYPMDARRDLVIYSCTIFHPLHCPSVFTWLFPY